MLSLGLSVGSVIFINPPSQYEVLLPGSVLHSSIAKVTALCWRLGLLQLLAQPWSTLCDRAFSSKSGKRAAGSRVAFGGVIFYNIILLSMRECIKRGIRPFLSSPLFQFLPSFSSSLFLSVEGTSKRSERDLA
jgi:hypothetical protein